jgi:glucokinase
VRVLVGDIGGTSARLAIVDIGAKSVRLMEKRRFVSSDFDGLAPIVQRFLSTVDEVAHRACFAVACPVIDGNATR